LTLFLKDIRRAAVDVLGPGQLNMNRTQTSLRDDPQTCEWSVPCWLKGIEFPAQECYKLNAPNTVPMIAKP
jgi:hypothetical protein